MNRHTEPTDWALLKGRQQRYSQRRLVRFKRRKGKLMIAVAIVRRRLREGKTYDDFRKAWYRETGFGTSNRMLTLLNVADPREVIVIGLTEASPEDAPGLLAIDAAERGANPLDDVVEPAVDRTFGILVAEDDFSQSGPVPYQPAAVGTATTDFDEVQELLELGASLLAPYLGRPGTP